MPLPLPDATGTARIADQDPGTRSAAERAIGAVAPWLRDHVHVDARDGILRLTGEVPDVASWRSLRRALLEVPAVRLVADGLQVTGARPLDGATAAVDVAERIAPVLDACARDGRVAVQADRGVVTLWGVLPSAMAQSEAVAAAWSSPHVRRVQDRTRVVP
jgi:osmotically-inducible protein OsmY